MGRSHVYGLRVAGLLIVCQAGGWTITCHACADAVLGAHRRANGPGEDSRRAVCARGAAANRDHVGRAIALTTIAGLWHTG